jgi:hypothetical protein
LIANLRGFPGNRSKAVIRQPVPLDNLLQVLVKRYRINQTNFHQVLSHQWPDIIGPQYHTRCSPSGLRKQILYIKADNPTLRQELYFQKREILKRIQLLPGGQEVKDIRFVTG